MSDRPTRGGILNSINEFETAFDSLFDEFLISRWRGNDSRTAVDDLGDRYQVRMKGIAADPDKLDIEASERRLIVRVTGQQSRSERIVTFRHAIDTTAVTARIIDDVLEVTLSKQRGRKIAIA